MDASLVITLFFIIIGIIIVIKNIISKEYHNFLWFCDFSPFLFAIGFYTNSIQFIKALINIGLITQLVTLVMLVVGFVSGKDVIGTEEAKKKGKLYVIVELLIHLLPVNVAFILTYHMATRVESLVYSYIIIALMFIFTMIFTPKEKNVNLLYKVKVSEKRNTKDLSLPLQTYLWILYTGIIVTITFLIQYFV